MNGFKMVPLDLLDPSAFEPREKVEPLETEGEITQPLVVRAKWSGRFEVLAGHRGLETLRARGAMEAPCRMLVLSDEEAALGLWSENEQRQDFTPFERGLFFKKFMASFGLSEREAAIRLGTSINTISLSLSIVRGRDRVLVPTNALDPRIYEGVVTTNKIKEVNSLPEEDRGDTLQAIVQNRFSTDETQELVRKIEHRIMPSQAANEIVLDRERRKPDQYAERKRRIDCPNCEGRGWFLRDEPK